MSKENNKVDINKHEIDIGTLKKQNVNDLLSIKNLYSKLKGMENKISQIKYIDSTLTYKLKKDYEKLKRIILDENVQAELANEIETINEKLSTEIETINVNLSTEIETINEKLTNDIESINTKLTNDVETINSQLEHIVYKNNNGLLIDISEKIKGASIYLPIDTASSEEKYISLLDKCIDSNCNTITICPIFWLESKTSNIFTGYKSGINLATILNYCIIAKNKGLKVAMKPHVGGEGITSHGDIQPTNLTTWISNYSKIYKELLNTCKEYIDIVCVTNELNGQTNTNLSQWLQLILDIRNIKSSFLIGAACHFGELSTNVFLSNLDFLGCNMYLPVEGDLSTNIEKQRKSLFNLTNNLNTLLKKGDELNKPIIITEVGILPFEISLSNPEKWGFDGEPTIKEEVQVRYYNLALKEYLYGNNILGTFIWNACDGYTFIDRKAQQTVKEIYGGVTNV